MTTGITSPASFLVTALYSLQNAMMLTPCWPSAGPTGGAGFACPAGICNLICPVIFFAIRFLILIFILIESWPRHPSIRIRSTIKIKKRLLAFFHLPILQFDRRIAAKYVHCYFQFAAIRFNFLDYATEIKERAIVNLDGSPVILGRV